MNPEREKEIVAGVVSVGVLAAVVLGKLDKDAALGVLKWIWGAWIVSHGVQQGLGNMTVVSTAVHRDVQGNLLREEPPTQPDRKTLPKE